MGDYVLFDLAFNDDADGLARALAAGRDANEVHPVSGHTPLFTACVMDRLNAISALLRAGADPNFEFTFVSQVSGEIYERRVALMYAESAAAVDLLVQFGARINQRDSRGWTSVAIAVRGGQAGVAKRLLEHGASSALDGEVAEQFKDLTAVCDSQIEFYRVNGDPAKAAPMISELEAIRVLLL